MQDKIAKKWYKNRHKNYQETNLFNTKNKAKEAEWEAIYDAFDINSRSHPKLVELGCGTGRIALRFLKKGFTVTGIEVSGSLLEILKKRAHVYKLSRRLRVIKNGLYIPLKEFEGKFDGGYMIVTYQSISNKPKEQKRVFKNFIRLIKPGGKFLILEVNPLNPLFYIFFLYIYKGNLREGYNIINGRRGVLVSLLREADMSDIRIFHFSFLPTFLINHWGPIKKINNFFCSIPIIRNISAYNIITAVKN